MISKKTERKLNQKRDDASESLLFLLRTIDNPDPQIQLGIDFNAKQYIVQQADYTLKLKKARKENKKNRDYVLSANNVLSASNTTDIKENKKENKNREAHS